MNSTDKPGFAAHVLAIAEIYSKVLSPAAISVYWNALQDYPLAEVQSAIERHVNDPENGRYFPKPADLLHHLAERASDDGRPGPDEAWGMLVRLLADERETGVLTEEMRAGWETCGPVYDGGDEIGARKCFLETYARAVNESRRKNLPVRWTVTLGIDPVLRAQRLEQAVAARRITRDHALRLLPAPTAITLDQVAGLLECEGTQKSDHDAAAKLRALADTLRAAVHADHERRAAEARERREREVEEKARLWNLTHPPKQDAA